MANDLVIVDLSHHNADPPNYNKAKQAGLIGIIHKASQGTTFVDSDYLRRKQDAMSAGLLWASYHFLEHGNISKQMDWYLSTIKPMAGERVVIDYEKEGCILDDLREAITCIEEKDPSLQITVYSGNLIKEQLGSRRDETLARTSLWIAQYRDGNPTWPTGTWLTWTLHQYSDGSVGGSPRSIAGIASPCDCNRFNGSRDNCAKWMGPATEPVPEPEPEPVRPRIDIETSGGVDIYIDGTLYVSDSEPS